MNQEDVYSIKITPKSAPHCSNVLSEIRLTIKIGEAQRCSSIQEIKIRNGLLIRNTPISCARVSFNERADAGTKHISKKIRYPKAAAKWIFN